MWGKFRRRSEGGIRIRMLSSRIVFVRKRIMLWLWGQMKRKYLLTSDSGLFPFKALKAFSLVNLRIYFVISRSQTNVIIGFIR